MNLTTTYLGLELPHPFIAGASPMTEDLDKVKQLADAGAAAVVMHSLFEEQIIAEQRATHEALETPAESSAEALSYFPKPEQFKLGPDEYLEQIRKIKKAVDVPVIASLNGSTMGGWLDYAKMMEQAGADAIELNVYYLATDPATTGQDIEKRSIEMIGAVNTSVRIPIAVKLSPFFSSLPHFARQLDGLGVDGLVLFNRFYQPDINVDELEVVRSLELSNSQELLLRLRWLAILSGRIRASLAVTGGVHTAVDATKAVMAGAHAVQMVSALLKNGPTYLGKVRDQMAEWMEQHEYDSLKQMQGSMNLSRSPDPSAYERANYMHILKSWQA